MDYRFSAKLPEGFPLDPGADEFLVTLENGRAVHCCGISCSPDGSPADLGLLRALRHAGLRGGPAAGNGYLAPGGPESPPDDPGPGKPE